MKDKKVKKDQKDIIFKTKHAPYTVSLKRVIITGVLINLIFLILFRWSWTRALSLIFLFALFDFVTFYLPAISKQYIITKRSLIRKTWFGSKEILFSQIGNIAAAKGKILVVSTNGKALLKIYEIYIDHSVREKFKDILFDRMEKS